MYRVLVTQLMQETATFNPVPSRYGDFTVCVGTEILQTYRATKTELAGALDIFSGEGVQVVPTVAAAAVSGGPMSDPDWQRLLGELTHAARAQRDLDGAYVCLHGAMAAEAEDDPEGRLLAELRAILGDKPIVASLDLHAVITDRIIGAADLLVPYHTYPHADEYETGQRAARNLLRMLRREVKPTTARVALPMLVRGDELITATGRFGDAIHACQQIERAPRGLTAGVIIGNAFTDVPALQSNVIVTMDDDLAGARSEAEKIGRFMWENRALFQASLTPLGEAIRLAENQDGLTVFSDAADATASGASGDSNAILRGLLDHRYSGAALLAIVDAPAAARAFEAGVGSSCPVPLGGTRDPGRFIPLTVNARVKSLHDGTFIYEDGTVARAGRTAVLVIGKIHLVVTTRPVYVVGRRVFQQHGLEPELFDLVVVKSPNGFRTWYEAIARRIVSVDVPGSTSANLRSLPFSKCRRPVFPLDDDVPSPFV